MRKFDKYKQNLRATDDAVYSYETRVEEVNHRDRTSNPLDGYTVTTSKHINYVGSEYGYEVKKVKPPKSFWERTKYTL